MCYHIGMNTKHKHTTNQTFSLPIELVDELHKTIKNMERSAYMAELLREGLEKKKDEIRQEYIAMGKDSEQDEIMKDWEGTIGDGISEEKW
jgi:metal-responsive CopG/Arc/MetJ family transcriptional regulator